MDALAQILTIGALAVLAGTQIYVVIMAFRLGVYEGIVTLFVGPIVVLFVSDIRKEKNIQHAAAIWGVTFVAFIVCALILSRFF